MQWIKAINWSVHVVPVWIKPLDNFLLYISVRNNQLAFFKALHHIFSKARRFACSCVVLAFVVRTLSGVHDHVLYVCTQRVHDHVLYVWTQRVHDALLYMYSVSTLCCAYVVF